jgi:hypothetical protein
MSDSFTLEELNEIKSQIDSKPRITDLRPWLWDTALKRERPRREPPNDPKKPPVRRPPGRRKPPVKEPPGDPNPGDPRPGKDRPIGDPPPKRGPQRLSVFPFVHAAGVESAP